MNPQIADLIAFINQHPTLAAILFLWSLVWKGFALWKSAELQQKYWFMAILILNTAGILEIIYLLFVARRYGVEVVEE